LSVGYVSYFIGVKYWLWRLGKNIDWFCYLINVKGGYYIFECVLDIEYQLEFSFKVHGWIVLIKTFLITYGTLKISKEIRSYGSVKVGRVPIPLSSIG